MVPGPIKYDGRAYTPTFPLRSASSFALAAASLVRDNGEYSRSHLSHLKAPLLKLSLGEVVDEFHINRLLRGRARRRSLSRLSPPDRHR